MEVPGYSVAHVLAGRGRSAISISLPGYGDTDGEEALVGIEDHAFVIDQVAAALRLGDYTVEGGAAARAYDIVVGQGISMGGLLLDVTQGYFASFEGIVPTAWSHGRFSEEADRCWSYTTNDCPEDDSVWGFYSENADPAVRRSMMNLSDSQPVPLGAWIGIPVWNACTGCWAYELRPLDDARPAWLRPDEVSRLIEVPVFSILGEEDFYYEREDQRRQGDHYPNAAFEFLLLPETGHAVFHHLNHRQVHMAVLDWMDLYGF